MLLAWGNPMDWFCKSPLFISYIKELTWISKSCGMWLCSWHSEELWWLLKISALQFLRTQGTTQPTACHISEDLHLQQHHCQILIIKPTRCTNFSYLFLEWNSTCFRQFLCPSSGVFHCTHSNGICHTVLQAQPACKLSAELYVMLCVQWKTAGDGQRNCLKHVEFHSKI
jgi:hypothetical protein